MPQPNGYSASGEQVTLTMTREDYEILIQALGFATGKASLLEDYPKYAGDLIRLVNRLNQGNPNYTPYATT